MNITDIEKSLIYAIQNNDINVIEKIWTQLIHNEYFLVCAINPIINYFGKISINCPNISKLILERHNDKINSIYLMLTNMILNNPNIAKYKIDDNDKSFLELAVTNHDLYIDDKQKHMINNEIDYLLNDSPFDIRYHILHNSSYTENEKIAFIENHYNSEDLDNYFVIWKENILNNFPNGNKLDRDSILLYTRDDLKQYFSSWEDDGYYIDTYDFVKLLIELNFLKTIDKAMIKVKYKSLINKETY